MSFSGARYRRLAREELKVALGGEPVIQRDGGKIEVFCQACFIAKNRTFVLFQDKTPCPIWEPYSNQIMKKELNCRYFP